MYKLLLGTLLGYFIHMCGIEIANEISNLRYKNCNYKVFLGELPKVTTSGQFYCLGEAFSSENTTFFEKIMLYQPNLWETL